jgi:Fur family peroxide stress response transcriptional regulator
MTRTPAEIAAMMDRFGTIIRAAGIKLTPQRLAIYGEVARTGDHPDIEAVFKGVRRTMPSVSLDTVYRTLALFQGLGLVMTVRPLGHHVRFDANTAPHHHFVCTRCGAAIDFEHRDFDALRVPASASALGRVDSRHVELRGLCTACAKVPRPSRVRTATVHRKHGTSSHCTNK